MAGLDAVLVEARQGHAGRSFGPNQVRTLIAALRGEGIEPTAAAAFEQLAAVQPPSTVVPDRLLDLSPETYGDVAVEGALHQQARTSIGERFHFQLGQLATETLASMLAEVDDYLAWLAGTFDQAAEHAHALVRLGVKATDQPGDLLRRSPEVVSAALLFQDKHAPVLDRVAVVRVQLSLILGIEPGGWVEDFGAAFMTPLVPRLLDPRRGYPDGWRRWLTIAERSTLRLLPVDRVQAAVAVQPRPILREDEDGRLVNTV